MLPNCHFCHTSEKFRTRAGTVPVCTLTQDACRRSISPGRGGLQDTYRVWIVGPDNCVGHRVALTARAVLMTAYGYHHADLLNHQRMSVVSCLFRLPPVRQLPDTRGVHPFDGRAL